MKIQKIAKGFRTWLPLWTILALVLGFFFGIWFHGAAKLLKALIVPASCVLIYFMCIPLRVKDFVNTMRYPKELVLGTLFSLVLAPLLMWPVARILVSEHPEVFAGLILAGLVPPGGMNTFWTGILGADVSLAMILQIVTFSAAILWIPFGMQLLAGAYVNVQFLFMFKKLLVVVVLPLILALLTRAVMVRSGGEAAVTSKQPLFQLISGVLALLLVFIATGLKATVILAKPAVIYLPAAAAGLYYLVTFFLMSFVTLKVLRIRFARAIPLIFGTATKNLSIAMALAVTTFGPQALLGVVACSLFQMPMASLFYKKLDRVRSEYCGTEV